MKFSSNRDDETTFNLFIGLKKMSNLMKKLLGRAGVVTTGGVGLLAFNFNWKNRVLREFYNLLFFDE